MEKGQIIATVILSGATVIKSIPDTVGLFKYKEFLQFYDGTKPHELDNETKELLEFCLYKIDMDPYLESCLQTFVAYGQDVLHKGTVHMKTGAIVGLPYYFRYKTASDIDYSKLTLKNKAIDWNSEHAHNFANSLILSDNAKKFAISREIYYVLNQHVGWDGSLFALNFGTAYCGYYALREFYQLKYRVSALSRFTIVGAFGMVALGMYGFMSDMYQRRRDRNTLIKTSLLGNDFVEGGVEFYDKLLQRNSALYHLLGENGPKFYTQNGNQRISFRMRNLPLTYQRDMLTEMLPKIDD